MTSLDIETKRKLREMGATPLLDAFTAQDEALVLGMGFSERIALIVDEAHQAFTHSKVDGLIRRAGLRYPKADLRRLDLVEERGLDRSLIAQLGTCTFIEGSAEGLVDLRVYAASVAVGFMMSSNSTGVSFPSRR